MTTDSGYTELALDHAQSPRNPGLIESPSAVGMDVNPVCGDFLTLTLKIEDGRITDAKQQIKGCSGAAIAASVLTELLIGRSVEEAAGITRKSVLDALGGLPASKLHSAILAEITLKKALAHYRETLRKGESTGPGAGA